ncbi:MAG: 2-dehydro-3-deoxy-6-phosphogalactonate aldolase [Rhodoferax sp.]|nr:2-dehydro-3-deoxy-6-phosphogalactonate aldolase [Rhodoferax sp.]
MNPGLNFLLDHPLVAILRGVPPHDVIAVADALFEAGFRVIEVPLNSPSPLQSIGLLAQHFNNNVLVGAGTVTTPAMAKDAMAAGAALILSPNFRRDVVEYSVANGAISMPGVATCSEAFDALEAGAHALKVFPADVLGPETFKAWSSVLPPQVPLFAVGGIHAENMARFRDAGAVGVGLGSSLYVPGLPIAELRSRAQIVFSKWLTTAP